MTGFFLILATFGLIYFFYQEFFDPDESNFPPHFQKESGVGITSPSEEVGEKRDLRDIPEIEIECEILDPLS